jgi:inosine/xanthosine triphosphate pyrophosphatase family protein
LNQTQQGIIVQGADDPALLVYALGKNPKKLQELSSISDPVDFAFKLAKLEAQLKVTNKKAPSPETRVKGAKTGVSSGSSDKVLERLRNEADKTGDYTKVLSYKKKLQNTKE